METEDNQVRGSSRGEEGAKESIREQGNGPHLSRSEIAEKLGLEYDGVEHEHGLILEALMDLMNGDVDTVHFRARHSSKTNMLVAKTRIFAHRLGIPVCRIRSLCVHKLMLLRAMDGEHRHKAYNHDSLRIYG